ncbi:hypothetical protein CGC20_33565 [Leishmania donovani]|uniref:Uncharacterized protein n=3 Tax=Leishmania donovani species complex TaxID=38574 RepID=A4I7N5_LEIIN|nr:conserved hypothetical protein [Leishmania infantum JPCM5]XP_003863468.1 hypothetical protein, conserved [Leishmania donovani]CAC9523269.1 hypothetical_protein_-_conserved [Leishmania infantum]AYU81596.1 hypothetical protein LdCL_320010500 [Leishmania donovani]TPP43563.1 hypothetical protein CGC21_19810 [Leishmania donovani]TPP47058.1 hypothetical protein CGC20_33565 [Leishmania donovani]CAM70819.1 conserved hypothetical protein [Leishmania infantum JPCM5]|eukprot:XP_001467754.1 conserved hypothetical protein [Leishmania infantum JPCM5]
MKITITTKMVGFPVFDSTAEYDTNDQLYAVVDQIKRRHGSTVSRIQLWKSKVEPTMILRDHLQPLSNIFGGEEQGSESSAYHCIYYDFSPRESNCTILNVN